MTKPYLVRPAAAAGHRDGVLGRTALFEKLADFFERELGCGCGAKMAIRCMRAFIGCEFEMPDAEQIQKLERQLC
jgi:hypothetical protein